MPFHTEPILRGTSTLYSSPDLFVVNPQTLFFLPKHSLPLLDCGRLVLLHSSSSTHNSKSEVLLVELSRMGERIFFSLIFFRSTLEWGCNIATAHFWTEHGLSKNDSQIVLPQPIGYVKLHMSYRYRLRMRLEIQ